ncbi:nucleoredoxin-like protein 2 [Rhipicephalus sanguineus]|uniref:nucleoredoxin-like protein 2 n=1 Tax=Rhipicephalus sanguineus TaxID=34632 RepID=UPI0018934830|nr:nucleoredoxin-like protein 2 [Rhipicephalus sanguineus]
MNSLRGKTLVRKDGTTITAEAALRNKRLICLYFAAEWCPPCATFTPILAAAYREAKDEGLPIEVVFVSSDRSEDEMIAFVKSSHENWPALPYGDPLQFTLKARYKISGIPTLVVLNARGGLVCTNGRSNIVAMSHEAFKEWLSIA